MILKGNQRGGSGQLARHFLKTEENEQVEVHELRGFVSSDLKGALHEVYAVSRGTQCKQFLYSLSLNPPEKENVPVKVFEDAIERVEKKLGLDGQPRAVVFHEKEGRRHAHCVWSRIRTDTMTAVNLSRWTGVRSKELKGKLGDPTSLPDVTAVKAHIANRMTPVVKGYIREAEAGFKDRASTLMAQRSAMTQRHRQERKSLDEFHEQRWDAEMVQRSERLPKGLGGIWSRITGRYARIRQRNEFETYQSYQRDQAERQILVERQLDARRALQDEIAKARAEHARDMTRLHQDMAFYMDFEQGNWTARDQFREAARSNEKSQGQSREKGRDLGLEP